MEATVLVFILAFAATNVDGFLCFAAALAVDPPRSRTRAVLAASGAFALLLCFAFAASLAIGRTGFSVAWFGILPAGIGVARLLRLAFGREGGSPDGRLSSAPSIASIVLATGADNVAVYAPLFALRSPGLVAALAGSYLLAWMAACAALAYAAPDLSRLHALKRYLEPVFAVLFIAIGVGIGVSS
jgi:cadmium resistance protein CadD (predicted permease)